MKTRIKYCIKHFGLTLVLVTTILGTAGCGAWLMTAAPEAAPNHPDPLAGWKLDFNPQPSYQIIEKDYQDYIQKLPPEEKKYVGPIQYFEDGTGQHAVKIEIGLNGTDWAHVLIYDKDYKRIKVIKYIRGHYRS